MSTTPVLVLSSPGAPGGAVAARLAAGLGRSLAAWDEAADAPLGSGSVRATLRDLLWARDRDWTCPPVELNATEDEQAGLDQLWDGLGDAVVHDPALPLLAADVVPTTLDVRVVVVVADHETTVRTLVATAGLEAGDADELVRVNHAALVGLQAMTDAAVVEVVDGDVEAAAAVVAERIGLAFDAARAHVAEPAVLPPVELRGHEVDTALETLDAADGTGRVTRLVGRPAAPNGMEGLDRYVGPRALARRQEMWALLGGPTGPRLELAGGGLSVVALPDGDLRSRVAGTLDAGLAALAGPPASVATVLLADVAAWVTVDDLAALCRAAVDVLVDEGCLAIGVAPVHVAARSLRGLAPLTSAAVREAAARADLTWLDTRDDEAHGGAVHRFLAHPPLVRDLAALREQRAGLERRVQQLETALERRVAERDRFAGQLEALRRRRVVRLALGLAEVLGAVVARLRTLVGR